MLSTTIVPQPTEITQFIFGRALSKKEIDLSVLEPRTDRPLIAIELKYPKNGQYPEQMFSFCKDLEFIEQLKNAGFQSTYLIILVDDPLFYKPIGTGEGIYKYFRNQQLLHGTVIKPTGLRNEQVTIEGTYTVTWRGIKGAQRYAVIESKILGVNQHTGSAR